MIYVAVAISIGCLTLWEIFSHPDSIWRLGLYVAGVILGIIIGNVIFNVLERKP